MTKDETKRSTQARGKCSCRWCGKMVSEQNYTAHLRGDNKREKCPNYLYTDGISNIARAVLSDDEYSGISGEEWAAWYQAEPGDKHGVSLAGWVML